MLLLLMLSLCAYEDDRETICAGCFAFHEPAFVIIAGMMRAWFHMVPEAAIEIQTDYVDDRLSVEQGG